MKKLTAHSQMKAKEYAARYNTNPGPEMVRQTIKDFMVELDELIKLRHVRTDAGFTGVLNELDDKWRAMARLVPDVKPNGFQVIIQAIYPKVYESWKLLNANNGHYPPVLRVEPTPLEVDRVWLKMLFGKKELVNILELSGYPLYKEKP